MVEERSQINPVEPAPTDESAAPGGASGDAASPWQTNGVIPEPTFKPEAEEKTAAGATEVASDATAKVDPRAADDGTLFLANLAKAMKDAATAERSRLTEDTDKRRDAHLASTNARREAEAGRIKALAADDRKAIDAWVAEEQAGIQAERARRTTALEADLQTSLAEHGTKIDREIERVEAAVTVYRADVDTYFKRLEGDDDPVTIAQQAGRVPAFPDLEKVGREVTVAAETAEAKTAATSATAGGGVDAVTAAGGGDAVAAAPTGGDNPMAAAGSGAAPTAVAATSLIGVMEPDKPQTKLAQAWAAWNESTKAADAAATNGAETATAPSPTATASAPTTAVAEPPTRPAAASPTPTAATTSAAPSSGEGNIDLMAGSTAPVAAGTWKPPAEGVAPEPASTSSGGALGWLRRDRDRDHGGR